MKYITSLLILSLILISFSVFAQKQISTYEIVIDAKSCKDSKITGQIECDYKVGKDLYINIAGIGLPDTAVTFMKADFNGDFYATYGILHGCVIVKRGTKFEGSFENMLDLAFISPKNGKVYKDWKTCKTAY